MAKGKRFTIGQLREAVKNLPDEAEYFPVWADGPPGDDEPAVEIFGVRKEVDRETKKPGLAILVGLYYLNEGEDEDE